MVSVDGVHGVGRKYPGATVFKEMLSRSELARRCQSCDGPCPPQGGADEDGGKGSGHVLFEGGFESSVSMTGLSLAQEQLCGQYFVAAAGSRCSRVQGCHC